MGLKLPEFAWAHPNSLFVPKQMHPQTTGPLQGQTRGRAEPWHPRREGAWGWLPRPPGASELPPGGLEGAWVWVSPSGGAEAQKAPQGGGFNGRPPGSGPSSPVPHVQEGGLLPFWPGEKLRLSLGAWRAALTSRSSVSKGCFAFSSSVTQGCALSPVLPLFIS